jgi:hypothetical protein
LNVSKVVCQLCYEREREEIHPRVGRRKGREEKEMVVWWAEGSKMDIDSSTEVCRYLHHYKLTSD